MALKLSENEGMMEDGNLAPTSLEQDMAEVDPLDLAEKAMMEKLPGPDDPGMDDPGYVPPAEKTEEAPLEETIENSIKLQQGDEDKEDKFFDDLASMMDINPSVKEEVALDLPEGVEPTSTAAKKILSLQNAESETRKQYLQYQEQANKAYQQMQQQMQQMQVQNARLEAQMEAAQKFGPQARAAQDYSDIDPEQPYEGIKSRILQEAQGAINPQMQEMQQTIKSLQDKLTAQEQQVVQRQRVKVIKEEARDAARKVIMSHIPEEYASDMIEDFKDEIMTRSYATGESFDTAAMNVHRLRMAYTLNYLKGKKAAGKVKLRQKMPKPMPSSGLAAKGRTSPSQEQLDAAGIEDHIDWTAMGKPALPPLKT